MVYSKTFWISFAAFACVSVYAQDPTPTPTVGDMLLYPSRITITGHFEAPLSATAVERATRFIGEQIDEKRAAEAARSQLQPLWDLVVWRYLPADPVHTLNSRVATDDDPFFTPEYLKVSARQLDNQLNVSERTSQKLFEH